MLTITTRSINGASVLDIKGRIVFGDATTALREAVRRELDHGGTRIILNLVETTYIDSSGFGELVGSYASVLKQGGEMRLCGHENTLMNLMEITRLNTSLKVFPTEAEALQSFPVGVAA
jgi:anti-sigma B factor antagonist